ncbi:alpha/beta hydrolase [bacterium]|nr:alpha/beta hydrolase [bacterium]
MVLLAVLAVAVAAGALYEPNLAISSGFLGKHVVVRGVPLRVHQQGTGRNVLLIHGSPGSIEDWQPVLDGLSGSFRFTVFDRPGHGFSGDAGQYSYRFNAEIALALIDELKLDHVLVVGHSYGGATALAMALLAPPAVDGFVVLDSATYRGSREPTVLFRLLGVPWLGIGLARVMPSSIAASQIRKALTDVYRSVPPEDFLALRTRLWSPPKVNHAIAKEILGSTPELTEVSPQYPSIRRPLAILAQGDVPIRKDSAERLHAAVAGSSLELVFGSGHMLQFQSTPEVLRTIRSLDARRPVPSAALVGGIQ